MTPEAGSRSVEVVDSSLVVERPSEAVSERVMGVLAHMLERAGFAAELDAVAAQARLEQVAAGAAAAVTLLAFVHDWLADDGDEAQVLVAALRDLATTLAESDALPSVTPLAAPRDRRAEGLSALLDLPGLDDEAPRRALADFVSSRDNLVRALSDDDTLDDYVADLELLNAARARDRKEVTPRSTEPAFSLDKLLTDTLPVLLVEVIGHLFFGAHGLELATARRPGAVVRLEETTGPAELARFLAAHPELEQENRQDILSALCAYNGLTREEPIAAGAFVYLPCAVECWPIPAGWPAVMPMAEGATLEMRRRLKQLAPPLLANSTSSFAADVRRLLMLLERMPVTPEAYETFGAAT